MAWPRTEKVCSSTYPSPPHSIWHIRIVALYILYWRCLFISCAQTDCTYGFLISCTVYYIKFRAVSHQNRDGWWCEWCVHSTCTTVHSALSGSKSQNQMIRLFSMFYFLDTSHWLNQESFAAPWKHRYSRWHPTFEYLEIRITDSCWYRRNIFRTSFTHSSFSKI